MDRTSKRTFASPVRKKHSAPDKVIHRGCGIISEAAYNLPETGGLIATFMAPTRCKVSNIKVFCDRLMKETEYLSLVLIADNGLTRTETKIEISNGFTQLPAIILEADTIVMLRLEGAVEQIVFSALAYFKDVIKNDSADI